MHAYLREQVCLFASTYGAPEPKEICCNWQCASGMSRKKSKDLVGSQDRNAHLSQHREPGG